MGEKYKQFSVEERCEISRLHQKGTSRRQIAAMLHRSPSSVAREIKRNQTRQKGYQPLYAEQQSRARRWSGSKLERDEALRDKVLLALRCGWSPEQVSKRLAQDESHKRVSYETIYRFIYAQVARKKDYAWRHYLPQAKSKRGRRGKKGASSASFIQHRTPISQRPSCVNEREHPGHWEADLMLFSQYGQAVLALHERYSRLLIATRPVNKQSAPIIRQLAHVLSFLPKPLRQTLTFDNGTEFSCHHHLHVLGVKTFFCDVYSPWQKGGIENAIGRLRRYLPRKTNLRDLSDGAFNQIIRAYNHTPRKCLDYQTPAEVFLQKVLHFECEFTFPLLRE